MIKYLLAVASSAAVMVAFQNCSKAEFAPTDLNGSLVAKAESAGIGSGEIPVDSGGMGSGGTIGGGPIDGGSDPELPACPPIARPGNGNGNGNAGISDLDSNCEDPIESHVPQRKEKSDSDGLYVCVLEGPGKSIKLGFVSDELVGKVATPDDVCMSRQACVDIISQYFSVKGPARRGFCPNKNPHVHHFSDSHLQSLIDKMKGSNP